MLRSTVTSARQRHKHPLPCHTTTETTGPFQRHCVVQHLRMASILAEQHQGSTAFAATRTVCVQCSKLLSNRPGLAWPTHLDAWSVSAVALFGADMAMASAAGWRSRNTPIALSSEGGTSATLHVSVTCRLATTSCCTWLAKLPASALSVFAVLVLAKHALMMRGTSGSTPKHAMAVCAASCCSTAGCRSFPMPAEAPLAFWPFLVSSRYSTRAPTSMPLPVQTAAAAAEVTP